LVKKYETKWIRKTKRKGARFTKKEKSGKKGPDWRKRKAVGQIKRREQPLHKNEVGR